MQTSDVPNRYMRTAEAGQYLSLSGRTLEKHRTCGTGPRYRKIGGRVVYALSDLEAWLDEGRRRSTSHRDLGRPLGPPRAPRRLDARPDAPI